MAASGGRETEARAALAGLMDVAEVQAAALLPKHLLVAVGILLLSMLLGEPWLVAIVIPYTVLDVTAMRRVRRLARLASEGRVAHLPLRVNVAIVHYALVSSLFTGVAVWVASHGTYLFQAGALMMLVAQTLHSIALNPPSRALAWMEAVAVGIGVQLVIGLGSTWATPVERAYLHAGVSLVSVFLIVATVQSGRLYERLRNTSGRLRNVERAGIVAELSGGIAHDFNNLLMVVRGNLELLRLVPEGERAALMAQIEEAVDRGTALVDRLSRTGRTDPVRAGPAPLAPAIERFERMARHALPANVRLRLDLVDAPDMVAADPAQLELALLNLTVNARDAMIRGGTILVRVSTENEDWLRIAVVDDGAGMTPEMLQRATTAYETTKPPGHGTGLGLAMVQAFVDESGGRLGIESAPGAGTRVEIVLPARSDAGSPPPVADGRDEASQRVERSTFGGWIDETIASRGVGAP